MGIKLKGIEIENFKSYIERQYIHFSDYLCYLVQIVVEKVPLYRLFWL